MRHVMVDIETLGVKPGSVILSIGACRFDETGLGEEHFYRPIDVFDQLMQGLEIDPATVGWWRIQSEQAKSAFQTTRPLAETLKDFAAYLKVPDDNGHTLVWAKGPDFDLTLLDAAYQAIGMKRPWSYQCSRDVRTILSLAAMASMGDAPAVPDTLKHHALGDAIRQAEQVRTAAHTLDVVLSEMV